MNTGMCEQFIKGGGCAPQDTYTPEQYLAKNKPNAKMVGISVDIYNRDIYIYYNEEK